MAESVNLSGAKAGSKPVALQGRLILQDPIAFDQATQPALRSSLEMTLEPTVGMERDKARELWENLSLEPEVAQERQIERKRLLARADILAKETAAAKAQALELQAQLAQARDQRFNHPLVYAGGVALMGLGALWWLERRKRIQMQERELEILADQTPSLLDDDVHVHLEHSQMPYALEDSPDLASDYATDLSGLPGTASYSEKIEEVFDFAQPPDALAPTPTTAPSELPLTPQPARLGASANVQSKSTDAPIPDWAQASSQPKAHALPSEEEIAAQSMQSQDRSLLSMSKRVLGNILRRRSQRDALHSSQYTTQASSSAHTSATGLSTQVLKYDVDHDSTQMQFDEEAQSAFQQEMLAQNLESVQGDAYDPDQANIELLSQTRVMPQRGESAMEHLLELRTAVSGLTALGRPEGAARLLEEHIAADSGTCAWAYLEYMNLCELMQKRDEFESMRKQYRQHFNRMAPYWHEPNSNVLGLDGYARAANELAAAWAQGVAHSHQTLAAWLVGPLIGRKLVQLPAYHDLFDLYEMLEFIEPEQASNVLAHGGSAHTGLPTSHNGQDNTSTQEPGFLMEQANALEQEFVPTVSLLDLDYEFSSDVTLEEREVQESEKAVTVVKTGNFSVDFNVAGTQMGALPSMPAELGEK